MSGPGSEPAYERAIHWEPADGRSVPVQGRGERTRTAILEAAVTVFGRDGFGQASMHDIADEANIASGTVYQYFADKADVLRCLLADLEDRLREETRIAVDDAGRMVVGEGYLHYLELYREQAEIYRAWWEQVQPPTEFTDAWEALHGSFRKAWVKALERGRRDGIVSAAVDPDITADLIEALYERTAHSRIVMRWDEEVDDAELAGVVAGLLGDGLLGPHNKA